jgi:hypothetical protein
LTRPSRRGFGYPEYGRKNKAPVNLLAVESCHYANIAVKRLVSAALRSVIFVTRRTACP